MYAADDRNLFDHRQHLELANLHRDSVSISISHQPAGRAVACHAKTAGIINDDQVRAAALNELGANAGASARRDEGFAVFQCRAQSLDDFFACVGVTFSSPGVGHKI